MRLALLVDDDLLGMQMTPAPEQTARPVRPAIDGCDALELACNAARCPTIVIMETLSDEAGLVARSSHGGSGVDGPMTGRMRWVRHTAIGNDMAEFTLRAGRDRAAPATPQRCNRGHP
jgi:hypothetical protein